MNIDRFYQMLGIARRANKIGRGFDSVIKSIQAGKALLVIIAEDSSDRTKAQIKKRCSKQGIQWVCFGQKIDIGRAIGHKATAVIAVKDINFVNGLLSIITDLRENGGD